MNGGTMLVGFNGDLFTIQNDFAVLEVTNNFVSCGCGQDYALAAMHVMHQSEDYYGEEIVKGAIRTAAKFSAFVDDNIDVLSL